MVYSISSKWKYPYNCWNSFPPGVAIIPFFIALSIHYFQIRQSVLVAQLESFTSGIVKHSKKRNPDIWSSFRSINEDILQLNIEMRAYSSFWSRYMTVYFAGYITMDTFLLYGTVFQTEQLNVFHKSFFVFYGIECLTLLLLITRECTLVVRNNVKIFKAQRRFCFAYSRVARPGVIQLLKVCIAV